MPKEIDRRKFIQKSILTTAGGALAAHTASSADSTSGNANDPSAKKASIPKGKIKELDISRMLLGGNLLTHYTHSRDLKYVYNLAAHYNTEEKICETLAVAETHGIDTLVIHTHPWSIDVIKKYRYNRGGKIKWIICPTAEIDDSMEAYRKQVRELSDMGCEAIYLWGVRSDQLTAQGRLDLIEKAVNIPKEFDLPSGVGAHDLKAIAACEEKKIDADFYIKTFHHHNYPSGPKPEELTKVISEIPGYWCNDPQAVTDFMKNVEKPWLAFKVMAAGAIPPQDAFQYAFDNGADHILAGMFDFEIPEDTRIVNEVLTQVNRTRPWRS